MPRRANAKGLYQRGPYWLDWDRRRDGSLRSPNLAIFWYDPERGRIRSATTGTADVDEGKTALDARYIGETRGESVCPTCGQPIGRHSGILVATAITNYQTLIGERRASKDAISSRLAHIVNYIASLPNPAVTCEQVDADWVQRFREWALKRPIVSPTGKKKQRTPGTVEASVRQLAAAINFALDPTGATKPAKFKARKTGEVSRTPQYRATVDEMAAMFRYASDPKHRTKRDQLHRYLILSVATLARPDAVHDFTTDPRKGQWASRERVLSLNPKGRAQTHKYRATVIVPRQVAPLIDKTKGRFVRVGSVRTAWAAMAKELGFPSEGEAGMKLIRRSMAYQLRRRRVPAEEVELQMGHRRLDSTSDLYAPFEPGYLEHAVAAIESVLDEILAQAPEALTLHVHRKNTGTSEKDVSEREEKSLASAAA